MIVNANLKSSSPIGFIRAKFDHEYRSKHFDIDLFSYRGKTISHYTDLGGLYGIVESNGFWLSDHRFLNDAEEFENGRKVTIRLLERLSRRHLYRNFRAVLEQSSSILGGYQETAYYVCSFSRDSDSLEQWRSYAQNGKGICITFDNIKGNPFFHLMPVISAGKIVYDDSEKVRIILRRVWKFNLEYNRDLLAGTRFDDSDWARELAESLAVEFIQFKNESYRSEQEIRLIASHTHLHHFKGLKHRVGRERIIPYLCTRDLYDDSFVKVTGQEQLPIVEIRLGPAANQEITMRSVTEYLRSRGYDKVQVTRSQVPYRG